MIRTFRKFEDIILYESEKENVYKFVAYTNNRITKNAYRIIDNNRLISNGLNQFLYIGKNNLCLMIKVSEEEKNCTCTSFLDIAICKHVVAACLTCNFNLPCLTKKVVFFNVENQLIL